jgi:hypothetical protein
MPERTRDKIPEKQGQISEGIRDEFPEKTGVDFREEQGNFPNEIALQRPPAGV